MLINIFALNLKNNYFLILLINIFALNLHQNYSIYNKLKSKFMVSYLKLQLTVLIVMLLLSVFVDPRIISQVLAFMTLICFFALIKVESINK